MNIYKYQQRRDGPAIQATSMDDPISGPFVNIYLTDTYGVRLSSTNLVNIRQDEVTFCFNIAFVDACDAGLLLETGTFCLETATGCNN